MRLATVFLDSCTLQLTKPHKGLHRTAKDLQKDRKGLRRTKDHKGSWWHSRRFARCDHLVVCSYSSTFQSWNESVYCSSSRLGSYCSMRAMRAMRATRSRRHITSPALRGWRSSLTMNNCQQSRTPHEHWQLSCSNSSLWPKNEWVEIWRPIVLFNISGTIRD